MEKEKFKYRFIFSKQDSMVYISHLDVMDVFRRAIRRSGFPFLMSKGFTPRVKISLPKALKLGVESDSEEIVLWFAEKMDPEDIQIRLNKELPDGLRIVESIGIG